MIQPEEFRNLYHSQFEPALKKLERARLKPLISASVSVIALIALVSNWSQNSFGSGLLHVIVAVTTGYYALLSRKDYRRSFKHKIVAQIVRLVNPDYKFFYDHHLPLKTFIRSGLFYEFPQDYEGDDYVSGTMDGNAFEFSEINATNGIGEEKAVVFRGLFLKMNFDRDIDNEIYLFPDRSDVELGDYYQRKQLSDRGSRVRMTSDKFERQFSVFSPKAEEARALLTPNMMGVIMEVQKLIGKPIRVSFVGSDVYCAIPYDGTIFEPQLFYTGVMPGIVLDIYRHFRLIEKIIGLLNPDKIQIEDDVPVDTQSATVGTKDVSTSPPTPLMEIQEGPTTEAEIPDEPLIDISLNLPALEEQVVAFKGTMAERDLQTYLLALYKNLQNVKEEVLTQDLLISLLSDSFSSEVMTMNESWLEISVIPEQDKMYRKVKNTEDLDSFTKPENSGWGDFDFTEEVLKFQIAELHKMKGNQLDNEMRNYGVASETGTPWYNFDPISNLSSGVKKLSTSAHKPTNIDWALIGTILQLGRVN